MRFAAKLKELREKSGQTQAALAVSCGLSLGAIRDYEQEKRVPSLRSAVQLARALGVDCRAFADCEDVGEEKPKGKKKGGGK